MNSHVIVLGAGLVGSGVALALQQEGITVTLLESAPLVTVQPPSNGPDLRCSALVPKTISFLKKLNVWQKIIEKRVGIFRKMQIWHESAPDNPVKLSHTDAALSELGFIVENREIQNALNENIQQKNIEMLRPVTVLQIDEKEDCVTVTFRDAENNLVSRDATVIIAADGANSWTRQHLNFPIKAWKYNQKAIVTYVRHQKSHQNVARQVFLSTGPLAFLPLVEKNLSSIVWSAEAEIGEQLMQDNNVLFNQKLSCHMSAFLGDIVECGQRMAFPLQMQHAQTYVKSRIVLIGDAAHTIHPLVGQGLNLGFADADELAKVIQHAQQKHRDIGALDTLRKFERNRKTKNLTMLAAVEIIKHSFAANSSVGQALLSEGLSITNRLWPLKKWIIEQASNP